METTKNPFPGLNLAPTAETPVRQTPRETVPEVDPLREARELVEAIRADCRTAPDEYLDEVYVPGGGE